MNILFISTFFKENGCRSYMTGDLIKALSKKGHRVTVAAPEEGRAEHSAGLEQKEFYQLLRIKTGNVEDSRLFRRAVINVRLGKKILHAVKKNLYDQKYDLIFYEAPPVTAGKMLNILKNHFGAPLYVFVREIFPQSAVDLALISGNSLIYRYFKKKQFELYNAADILGFASEGSARYSHSLFDRLERGKSEVFPFTKALGDKRAGGSMRKKYGIPDDCTVFFFGGGIGTRQAVKFICSALEKMAGSESVRFVFDGTGSKIKFITERLKACKNVIVTKPLTREETEQFASESDVGVVTLDHRFSAPYFQEIIVTYLQHGLPVLAATDPNNDFRNLLRAEKCGVWCASNDIFSFCNEISRLAGDAAFRRELAENASSYASGNLDILHSAEILEAAVLKHRTGTN